MWLSPSSRKRYFFENDGRLAVTREGWEKYISWVRLALDEKRANDRFSFKESVSTNLKMEKTSRPTLQQLLQEQNFENE